MIPEYHTLAHPNAQIDNAIFWRNDSGLMECGLIDPWRRCLISRRTAFGGVLKAPPQPDDLVEVGFASEDWGGAMATWLEGKHVSTTSC